MKLQDLRQEPDWDSLSWAKSFRGNTPPLNMAEARLTGVARLESGALIIQTQIGRYQPRAVLRLIDPGAESMMGSWLRERIGRRLGDLDEEEVSSSGEPART